MGRIIYNGRRVSPLSVGGYRILGAFRSRPTRKRKLPVIRRTSRHQAIYWDEGSSPNPLSIHMGRLSYPS